MPSQEKIEKVEQIKEWFEGPESVIVLHYLGLKVLEANQFRRLLGEREIELRVLKNTLTRIALQGSGREPMTQLLEGPVAVAFINSDPAGAARTIKDFSRGRKGLYFLGGMLGDRLMDAGQVDMLASLPSREILLGRAIGQAAAPLSGLVGVCAGPLRKLLTLMSAIAETRKTREAGQGPDGEGEQAAG